MWSTGCRNAVVFPGRLMIEIFSSLASSINDTERWQVAASYSSSCGLSVPIDLM